MLSYLWHWFNDPLVQSVLVSPLVGAVLGVILGGLSGSSPPGPASTPVVILIERRTVINRNSTGVAPVSSDPYAPLIGFVVAVAVVLWLYTRFAYPVLRVVLGAVLSCLAFVVAVAVVLLYRGYPRNSQWYSHVLAPFAGLLFSVYLVDLAQRGIDAGLRERASQLGALPFFASLRGDEGPWIVLQIAGSCLLVSSAIFSIAGSLHFVAQLSLGGAQRLRGLWLALYRATRFASGWVGVACVVAFSILAYLALSGVALDWLSRSAA